MPDGFGRRGFFGRGPGRGMGFGFRGSSPPWPYVGLGRGGLSRCGYFFSGAGAPTTLPSQVSRFYSGMSAAPGYAPYSPPMTRDEEINYLKDQAVAIKGQLEEIESRISQLSTEKE